jgi:hypothetical protein
VPRALVIGAETGGLAGVNHDAMDIAACLTDLGFVVDLRIGRAATRDAILDGARALVADARADDPTIIYYSGHGGMLEVADAPAASLGYLAPTDHDLGGPFRGIMEPEWSILVTWLTARTRNVVVIHDCCHAAQTVRGVHPSHGRVRALASIRVCASDVRAAVEACGGAVEYPLGNPDVVRLAATSGRGLAWERADQSGRVRGVFTTALLSEMDALRERAVSWAEFGRCVRDRVLRTIGRQRPEIEGPINRRVFGLDSLDLPPRISVRPEGRRFVLAVGRIHGVECGDIFQSTGPGAQTALVVQPGLFESIVRVEMAVGAQRTFQAAAVARTTRYGIALEVSDEHMRAAIADAIADTPRLRVGGPGDAIARIRIEHDRLLLLDDHGALGPGFASDAAGFSQMVLQLSQLAATRALQHVIEEFEDPGQLVMTVEHVGSATSWLADEAEISPADRLCLHVMNKTQRTLWLHVFAIRSDRAVEALGPVSSGIPVDSRSVEILGAVPGLGSVGFTLKWAAEMEATRVQRIELVAIATTVPVDLASVPFADLRENVATRAEVIGGVLSVQASRDLRAPSSNHRAIATRRRLRLRR